VCWRQPSCPAEGSHRSETNRPDQARTTIRPSAAGPDPSRAAAAGRSASGARDAVSDGRDLSAAG